MSSTNPKEGATALRSLLALYGDNSEISIRRQIEGVLFIKTNPRVEQYIDLCSNKNYA